MVKLDGVLQKCLAGLKKYKYAVLVLLLGVVLLLIPHSNSAEDTSETKTQEPESTDSAYAAQLEKRLSEVLGQIDGVGRVEVMLTLQRGSQTEYQTDIQTSTNGETQQKSEERKTVILSEGSAYDKAAIAAVEYPQFLGALIVCQGADLPTVRLELISAVSALTGLRSDQITVVKMK